MPIRVGFLGVAHMHAWGYVHALQHRSDAQLAGVWDSDPQRAEAFASKSGQTAFADADQLLSEVDAVVICSENRQHAALGVVAAQHGKHILCEKPLVTSKEEADVFLGATKAAGVKLMTAFPCRYSPAWTRLKERVKAGDVEKIKAICATNRGRCPFDWFVETDKSGGGAMIDHTVHVADLLRDLLGKSPERVFAQTGHNMYEKAWEDTAMLTLDYGDGVFATLDSSWSRSQSFKTWGDVTMSVVGEEGVIEMDMFGQAIDRYQDANMRHTLMGWGSNLDGSLVDDFVRCILNDTAPTVSGEDGWEAARVALAGYEAVRTGQPVALA